MKAAEQLHDALVAAGEPVGLYHGRLSAAKRHAAQDAFMSGRMRVMVATNAFGLGIDKPDIRFVIHYQVPSGLDAYCQESGRAGRDAETAVCTLLFVDSDRCVQQFFLSGRYPQLNQFRAVVDALGDTPPDERAGNSMRSSTGSAADARSRWRSMCCGSTRWWRPIPKVACRFAMATSAPQNLERLAEACEAKVVRDRAMLERMIAYAQSGQCRWRLLLEHLEGAPVTERCRTCDNCLRPAAHEPTASAETSGSSEQIVVPQTAPFAVGSRVRTRRHGHAEVIAIDALSVTVIFENGQRRSFQPKFLAPARGASTRARNAAPPIS